jgi:hypothetical protein
MQPCGCFFTWLHLAPVLGRSSADVRSDSKHIRIVE